MKKINEAFPKVGIFWVYKAELIGVSLIPKRTADIIYGDPISVDTPVNHHDYWNKFKNSSKEFIDREYDELPRGRVLYDKESNKYVVYSSKTILNSNILKELIIDQFSLPRNNTIFSLDDHYIV